MKKLLFILIFMFGSFSLILAQDNVSIVSDNGTSVTTCNGSFSLGSYTAGTTYTVTVCSDDPLNRYITLTGGVSGLTGDATLCVYDGDDTSADQLICWDSGSTGTLGAYASNTNETGCLTFEFTSSTAGATFSGILACQFICPAPLLVNVISSSPSMVNEGGVNYTNVCWDYANNQSETVTFTAEGSYPSGTGYALDDANVTFTWNFNDGSPEQSGLGLTEVTHNFPTRQGYTILLSIEDSQGCLNTNSATHRVRVARTPLWSSASTVDPAEICMGAPVEMCAAYGTAEWNSSIVPSIADTVSLPDGNGVCYNSQLMQNQFLPGQTLESINDLNSICMNLEHSFLGDLTIDIQCPSGQSVTLQTQGGSGTFLGEPIDAGYSDNNEVPGVGYWYCITEDATQTLTDISSSVSTIPAGDYASAEDLAGLEGCLLNGQWTITICDNWSQDDGYIFGWYLDFDASLFPDMWSYTPDYTPSEWYGLYGAELDNPIDEDCVTGTYMTTDNPSENSDQPFIFTLVDDFGCEHDTAMYVTVLDENNPTCCVQPTPDPGANTTVCGMTTNMDASNPADGNNGFWELVNGPGTANFVDETDPQTEVTVTIPGTYQFSWTEQFYANAACETSETVSIEFQEILDPTITAIDDMCGNDAPIEIDAVDFGTLTANPNIPDIETGIIDPEDLTPGTTYIITNTLPGTCYTQSSDTEAFTIFDEIQIIDFNDQNCIPSDLYEVVFTVVGSDGVTEINNYTVNGVAQTNADFYATHTSATAYNYLIEDANGCSSIEIQGFRDCGCPSPGTMTSLELVNLCGNECTGASISHNGDDYHPDALPYVLGYIIHQGDINAPIAYNSTDPDFCRNTLGLNYGDIYYISAVTSHDDNSNSNADPTDGCYSAAQGTPVRWMQTPSPDAGIANDTCALVMPLNASDIPAGMVGYWSSTCNYVAVGGTNYHDPDMIANVTDYGDCVFTWNIVNGQCVGSDDVVISFNSNPIPYAGNDTIVCGTEIELSVENSIPGTTFQWSGNANFNPATGATTTITVSNPGTYQFTLTEYNGSCFEQDQVLVTFISAPQPNIVSNVDTVCGTNTCLQVNNVNGEGFWTASATGGINTYFDDNTDPNTCVTIDNYTGNYRDVEFTWTETNQFQGVQCQSTANRDIVFAKIPNAFVGDDNYDEVCGNTYTFHADTTGTGWANMYWMVKEGISYSFDDASIPNATVTINPLSSFGDSAYVQIPFQWVVSSGGGCSDIDTMWVTFYKQPVANAGLDDSI
ncbi:MAG: PKD domain-containing protein, partial [Bacteroidales bacterium]|nr:PKD domain-containing protein [Bacteroidales bacterium]